MKNGECVYLGDSCKGKTTGKGEEIFDCRINEKCVLKGDNVQVASCELCRDKLRLEDKDFSDRFIDFLYVTDREARPTTAMRGLLANRTAFLIGGGPSANSMRLGLLNDRGCWSLAVNNVAGHSRFQPQAFVCSDPPSKFHNGIWMDPRIMKFIPSPKMIPKRGRLRYKRRDGMFEPLHAPDGTRLSASDSPNVWGFGRRAWLSPDDSFFLDTHASWGNHNVGTERTGQPKTVCTMLLGLRVLYYLGARRIFLVGVDFKMDPTLDLCENYSFGEERNEGACRSNNSQFAIVNKWLCELQETGVFSRFGLEIYNCYDRSGLRAFPYVPFEAAVNEAKKEIPEEPFDLRGWYYKKPKEKKEKKERKGRRKKK